MVDLCSFPDSRKDTPCSKCGYKLRADFPTIPHRRCSLTPVEPPNPKPPMELGDLTERVFNSLVKSLGYEGDAKELYVEMKEEIGLDPNCNCDLRKEWLNELSRKVKRRLGLTG